MAERRKDSGGGGEGLYSNRSLMLQKSIEFHSPRKQSSSSSSSNGGGKFPLETLNSKINGTPSSKNENGEVIDHGLDPELSFRITFRRIGAGLQNLGNTCFLNSVLQCLTYTEPFAAYLQSGTHKSSCQIAGFCALCAIQNHVRCALQSTGRIVAPRHLVSNIRCISRNFRYARQEDAHEYMVNLLESMHKCCLPLGLPSESPSAYERSLVYKIFGGRLRSQVKCTECLHGSNKFDPFLDLSIEIAKADSLLKALRNFTAVEELDGGEKQYHCQSCNQKVRAVRQLMIHKAPYVLSIHLKRFGSYIPGEKINKRVEFGPTLDLKPFVTGAYEGDLKYTLYGVLVHAGWSTHSGHYYCFVRTSSGMWYVLNDNEVFQVKEKTVLEQKAYMLFYVRDRKSISTKKPVAIRKENVAANEVKNKERSLPIFGSEDSIQNDVLAKASKAPVSAPIVTKADEVACSIKEFIQKIPCDSKSRGLCMEGSDLSVDSLDSSLKVSIVLSAPNSCNTQSCLVNLPNAAPSVVGAGTVSHPSHASTGVESESADGLEETKATDIAGGLPQINSSVAQVATVSRPSGAKNITTQEREETIKDSTISVATDATSELDGTTKYFTFPVGKHTDCSSPQEFASKTSPEDMEHKRASVRETVQSKVPCQVSILRPDEDNSDRLSSQSGNTEALCQKTSDLDSLVAGSTPLSSQLSNEELLCKNNIDLVPKVVDSVLLSCQAGTEEVLCKEVTDLGPGFVASTMVSKQSVTEEALYKSTSDLGPEDCQVSNYSHKETLCIKAPEVSNIEPEQMESTLSSQSCSGQGTEVCQLSSQLITEEALFKGVSDIDSEQVEFMLSNQSGTREALSKGVSDLGVGEVTTVQTRVDDIGSGEIASMQLSDQLGMVATCKRARELVTGEVCSTPSSSRRCINGNNQDGSFVNESHSTEQQSAEENAPEREESKSVVALVQSGISNRCGRKEPLSHPDCQKMLKSRKHMKKSQVVGTCRSSLMLRASMWIRKKKKHKKSRNHNFDNSKSAKKDTGKYSQSDLEPSTSEKTRMGDLVLSRTQRRKGKSGANTGHDRTAVSELMESYPECVSRTVVRECEGRVDHSDVVLARTELPVEALTANSCNSKECDNVQSKSSVHDFMNLLTRGLEDITVARWDQRDTSPSEIFGNSTSISIGYVPDEWDVEYDRGKRKKARRKKNGFNASNPFQEIAEKKSHWKKPRMDQSSSGYRPFRI